MDDDSDSQVSNAPALSHVGYDDDLGLDGIDREPELDSEDDEWDEHGPGDDHHRGYVDSDDWDEADGVPGADMASVASNLSAHPSINDGDGDGDGASDASEFLHFGVDDAVSDDDDDPEDSDSVGAVSVASSLSSDNDVGAAHGAAHGAAPAPGAAESALGDRTQASQALLRGHALASGLSIWGLIAGVSSNNMQLLYSLLHAQMPDACHAANLPKRYSSTVKRMAKAEAAYRGDDKGWVAIKVPVTEDVLVAKRIEGVTVIRRSIRETVSRILQNSKNAPGSLRIRGVSTPGLFGDSMNSPMLMRIQSLTDHLWAASGVPEDKRLTIYTAISKDGTGMMRSKSFPVEASTLTVANLDRDNRNSNGNCKLLSVYRAPTLHNPTVASQKKSKYKPTTEERHGMSRVNQVIEQMNVDEFIELMQNIFELSGICGLDSAYSKVMSLLILPLLWLGDLLGQNKLACLLSWACRRCMVRYKELGAIIIRSDGTTEPSAPALRFSNDLRTGYALLDNHGSAVLLDALGACSYARPALLNLGAGDSGIGVAGLDRGFLVGVADDWTHFGPLGIIKMTEQLAALFIVDAWPDAADGVLAVRRFELRIAENESFNDGVIDRGSFLGGFLRDAGTLLTAEERDDLLQLFVCGIGTDNLVIPVRATRDAFQSMIEDLVYIASLVKGLSIDTVTLEKMQKANHRFCVVFKRFFSTYSKFKFNKFHVWQHLGDMIREWGMVWNYWMESAELAHKLLLKNLLRALQCLRREGISPGRPLARIPLTNPFAALTNYKNALVQICRRLQRREFAIDVAIEISGLTDAAKRVLQGVPATDAPRHIIEIPEFNFTGKSKTVFSKHHPLFKKMRDSWKSAVQGVFGLLTGSHVWPPVGAPAGMVDAAVLLNPDAVQLYRGVKIMRPGVSNTTLQCSPSFHGRPRQDTVLLSGGPGATYDDIQTMEYGLVHCFFSYSDPHLVDFLRWGAHAFEADVDEDAFVQFTQFFLMQRFRPSELGNDLLPMRFYAAKELSNDFETEVVGTIHSRARPMPWFHGTAGNDMKKKKGAVFCLFK